MRRHGTSRSPTHIQRPHWQICVGGYGPLAYKKYCIGAINARPADSRCNVYDWFVCSVSSLLKQSCRDEDGKPLSTFQIICSACGPKRTFDVATKLDLSIDFLTCIQPYRKVGYFRVMVYINVSVRDLCQLNALCCNHFLSS